MKFEILTEGFERLGEETAYSTIPLRSTATRRDFFLNVAAKELLELPEGEHDFEDAFGELSADRKQDLEDGLVLLSAFGGARITKENPESGSSCFCRVAGERDYRAIANLINGDSVYRMGTIPKSEVNMNEDMIRARQFNNLEYNFLYWKDETLKAVLLAGMPAPESYSAAFRLCGIAVSDDFAETERRLIAEKLINYTIDAFRKEFSVCRYLSFSEKDDLADLLMCKGFVRTAYLPNEAENGRDVTVYDMRVV